MNNEVETFSSERRYLSVLDRQLLIQLGERLRRLRKEQKTTGVDMAARVGISRATLSAVEAGDPSPSIGMYLRVMSALCVGGDLALLASGVLRPKRDQFAETQSGSVGSRVEVVIRVDAALHRVQDLKSLALHEAAVAAVKQDPQLLSRAESTLQKWLSAKTTSRSVGLWREWAEILERRNWCKVLGKTQRAQQLRQASPLVVVLTDAERRSVLDAVADLKAGVVLGEIEAEGKKPLAEARDTARLGRRQRCLRAGSSR